MPLTTRKCARGTCLICNRVNVTTYHYSYAHGLRPKDIFRCNDKMWRCSKHKVQSLDPHKMMGHYWLKHVYSDYKKLPHKTREPYDYSQRAFLNLSKKWRTLEEKPVSKKSTLKIDSNQYKETPVSIISSAAIPNQTATSEVVASTSDYPPITAEAIVNAFEKRVIQIDAQLEAKDKLISQKAHIIDTNNETIFELNKALAFKDNLISEQKKTIDETTKALNAVERELLYPKPLEEPTPASTDFLEGLLGRLFKR